MLRRLARLLALLLGLAACGGQPAASDAPESVADPGGASATEPVRAVATVFPLAWMAERIAPDVEVTALSSGGQDPHDLELSPVERALVESAGVVLYLGDIDFQPQVEAAISDATGEVVAVAELAGADLLELDHEAHEADHTGDHAGHGVDPHLWFDAALMGEAAIAVGEAFAAVDAGNAEVYRSNAREVQEELTAVEGDIDAVLSGCAHGTAIVSHEAYAYLLEPRGLAQEGISGAGGHSEVSPQRLAELTERIRAEGIPAVVAEPVEGRQDAEALAAEAGVDLVEVDPLEAADEPAFATGYPELLREQAAAFATALSCG